MEYHRDHSEGRQLHIRRSLDEAGGHDQRILMRMEHSWTQLRTQERGGSNSRHGRRMLMNFYWQGSGSFRHGKQEWEWQAPCCVMRRVHQQSWLQLHSGHYDESWVICSGSIADLLTAGAQVDESRPVIAFNSKRAIQALLHRLANTMDQHAERRSWALVLARLQILCAHIWGTTESDSDGASGDMHQIRQAVRSDPSRNWRLDDLAELCRCRPATLRQRFHRQHQCGPCDVVTMERMEMAGDLLQQMLVKQLARHLGYNDYRSFSRQFKKYYGSSPQEYMTLSKQ